MSKWEYVLLYWLVLGILAIALSINDSLTFNMWLEKKQRSKKQKSNQLQNNKR